ncbi:serine hydrolase domain-containing protein [Peristeroidobacter soli]|uniref:serine hydrolase domain-containing protein n=1 Tax=Peristeroidobacter soli TaxID=2497877 RepID=UPI0013004195|nr:serine hydrolase domain-containing protein [Peristeroidobacter soli]
MRKLYCSMVLLTLVSIVSLPVLADCVGEVTARRSGASSSATESWTKYVAHFDEYVRATQTVGASTLLVKDGRVAFRRDTGMGDLELGQRIDANSLFQYGSITKTLTAITVLQLRDRGQLSLDDAATRYLPELRKVSAPPGWADRITIRMLLDHSAGFQVATWPWKQGLSWEPFEPTSWEQLVSMLPYQQLRFEPGERYSYSNPAYVYLARIVEVITGEPWLTYVQKNVFAPLGMNRSYFGTTPHYLAKHRSNNYTIRTAADGRPIRQANGRDFDPGITNPNGGWNAPLDDVARYLCFLTGAATIEPGGQRLHEIVLARTTLEEMWQPQLPIPSSQGRAGEDHIGLSFFIKQRGELRIIGHTGSQAGFHSFLYFNPATRTGVIAAFNTDNVSQGNESLLALRELAFEMLQ